MEILVFIMEALPELLPSFTAIGAFFMALRTYLTKIADKIEANTEKLTELVERQVNSEEKLNNHILDTHIHNYPPHEE